MCVECSCIVGKSEMCPPNFCASRSKGAAYLAAATLDATSVSCEEGQKRSLAKAKRAIADPSAYSFFADLRVLPFSITRLAISRKDGIGLQVALEHCQGTSR